MGANHKGPNWFLRIRGRICINHSLEYEVAHKLNLCKKGVKDKIARGGDNLLKVQGPQKLIRPAEDPMNICFGPQ